MNMYFIMKTLGRTLQTPIMVRFFWYFFGRHFVLARGILRRGQHIYGKKFCFREGGRQSHVLAWRIVFLEEISPQGTRVVFGEEEGEEQGGEREREVGIEGWRKVLLVGFREKKQVVEKTGMSFWRGFTFLKVGFCAGQFSYEV